MRTMRPSRLVFGTAAALVMAILLSDVTTAGAQKRGGTLRVAYGNEISNLDFHTAPGYELVWAVLNMNCGLISMTPDGKFVPDAAESWQISPDGLLYTFKLVEWVKGSHLVMDRFDKYFEPGLPYLDRVVIRVIRDPVTQMAAFKAGEIDFIADLSADHVDTLRAQNPRAQIMTGKETTPMVAMMKVTVPADGKPMSKDRGPHPIFIDIRVRKPVRCYGI